MTTPKGRSPNRVQPIVLPLDAAPKEEPLAVLPLGTEMQEHHKFLLKVSHAAAVRLGLTTIEDENTNYASAWADYKEYCRRWNARP